MGSVLDGEDILKQEDRAELEATMQKANDLNRQLLPRPKALPEPSEEVMQHTRQITDSGLAALKLVDV
jgi:hypothetical protein